MPMPLDVWTRELSGSDREDAVATSLSVLDLT